MPTLYTTDVSQYTHPGYNRHFNSIPTLHIIDISQHTHSLHNRRLTAYPPSTQQTFHSIPTLDITDILIAYPPPHNRHFTANPPSTQQTFHSIPTLYTAAMVTLFARFIRPVVTIIVGTHFQLNTVCKTMDPYMHTKLVQNINS